MGREKPRDWGKAAQASPEGNRREPAGLSARRRSGATTRPPQRRRGKPSPWPGGCWTAATRKRWAEMPGNAVRVISFGYGHGAPPPAHITVDVRAHFRDPHVNPDLRNLTAADQRVVRAVMSTPGVRPLISSILGQVRAYQDGLGDPAPGHQVAVGARQAVGDAPRGDRRRSRPPSRPSSRRHSPGYRTSRNRTLPVQVTARL